jgi:16S rRNA (cytosine1407-C5)-methyltransferase
LKNKKNHKLRENKQVSNKIYDYLDSLYGQSSAEKYLEFISEKPSRYIRVNKLKTTREKLSQTLLKDYNIKTEEIKNIEYALKITEDPNLLGIAIEHIIGEYYIQGLSSMIPPLILNPSPDDIVLDLCAAPGSKTTELAEMMENRGTLISNEVQLNRLKMLVYNLDRMNIVNTGVTHTKGEWLSKHYNHHFDKVLVDAPCSGLGIIQKKGEVNDWWSLERAERLGDLQLRLLIGAIKMAKVGGEIVYSTCTLTPEENELVLNKVLEKYPVEVMEIALPVESHQAFTSYNGKQLNKQLEKARRILPWEADTDGFFIIKLKKTGETEAPEQTLPNQRELKLLSPEKKEIRSLLQNIYDDFGIPEEILSDYQFLLKSNDVFLVSKEWEDPHPGYFQRIGTKFGVIDKNGRLVFHTQAAQIFQDYISKNIYQIENQYELRKYLEGGTIKKEIDIESQCVIKYKGFLLGTAVVTKTGIKSRFPRAKRTQEIFTDF